MPAKQKDPAADEQANLCSCGHHYSRSGSRNDATTAATAGGTADSVSGSSSSARSSSRPLDASFVQVPQHDYSTAAQHLQHQEELQKHGAGDDVRGCCSGKAESYRRLVRLQQAAHSYSTTSNSARGSPAPPPPALCLYCIHR